MLRPSKDLLELALVASDGATDGAIGDVRDLYFDDEAWAVRYLVVETGSWLSSRMVLVSPIAAGKPDFTSRLLPVSLTREQVRNSPDIDTDMPVTRQHETDYFDYYSYPYYWGGAGMWAGGGYPTLPMPGFAGYGTATSADADGALARENVHQQNHDPHLRSCREVVGYHIEASDGEIGQVQGLLVDDDSWAIRYLVVSTSSWWLGHDVLVAPQWIQRVSWAQRAVTVDLTRDALKQAPRYDRSLPLSREMELAVYQHYGRAADWPGAQADLERATRPPAA
jgi:hypothetical protein